MKRQTVTTTITVDPKLIEEIDNFPNPTWRSRSAFIESAMREKLATEKKAAK